MTHKRNTSGLARAAKDRRELTIKRVEEAIKLLIKEQKPINFNSISTLSKVGKSWLYKEDSVRKKIEALRSKPSIKNGEREQNKNANKKSQKSNDQIVHMLKDRIRKLELENNKLREQVEVLYGKLYANDKS